MAVSPKREGIVAGRWLRVLAMLALTGGLLLRTIPLLVWPELPLLTCDGLAYHSLAVSLGIGQGLTISDPSVVAACGPIVELGPSHHFAPALAVVESWFISLMGDTSLALVLPVLLLSWLTVFVVWWATRNLFGSDAGLLVAAAVSLEWTGALFGTWQGYSENLVIITFTLTMWAILKALSDDRYLVLAGLFAGIGYLSKASIGWFFLLAGIGGLTWRLWFRGRAVLRNGWYLSAIAVFAVPFVVWSFRNLTLFWDGTPADLFDAWQTSEVQARYVTYALQQPALLLTGLVGKLPIMLIVFVLPFLPFLRDLGGSFRRLRDEETSGLWLSVALIFVLGWFFAGAFWVTEQTSLMWADPVRYLAPAQIPLLWLLVRDTNTAATWKWAVSFLVLAALTGIMWVLMIPGFPLAQ